MGRLDHAQVLVHRKVIRSVGHHADDDAAGGLLGLVDQLLEVAPALALLLGGGRELIAIMELVLAGVAKDQEAFGRASAESNRQEDDRQQSRRVPHDARDTGGPGGGGPILHVSPTGHGHSRPAAVNISLRQGLAWELRRNRGGGAEWLEK